MLRYSIKLIKTEVDELTLTQLGMGWPANGLT